MAALKERMQAKGRAKVRDAAPGAPVWGFFFGALSTEAF